MKQMNPLEMQLPWMADAVHEVQQLTPLRDKTAEEMDAMVKQQAKSSQPPGTPAGPNTKEPVLGSDLGPTLQQQMQELRAILGAP